MDIELSIDEKIGVMRVPKQVREALGKECRGVASAYGLLIYPKDADPDLVLGSLDIISQELRLKKQGHVAAAARE